MKRTFVLISVLVVIGFLVSMAHGNPAMIPKHPGYPAKEFNSPVTGQPLANDPGQTNATGDKALTEAAAFDDSRSVQELSISPPTDQRLLGRTPGQLPKVEGPQIKIEPPVKEGTRMK